MQLVWIETPTNPLLRIVDIAAVCEVAHQQPGVFVVVDNTFATPYFQVIMTMSFVECNGSAGVQITPKFLVDSRTTYLGNLVVLRYMW